MLRYRHKLRPRRLPKAMGRDELGRGTGPQGRIDRMKKMVTALVRHERLEGKYIYLDEARGYAERLIQEAQRNGDTHRPTMELADYWLLEKDLIHKLFKVLVPRYSGYSTSVTQVWNLPTPTPGWDVKMAILELKGNPWPPVVPKERDVKGSLVNVLLDAARKDYRQQKYRELAKMKQDQKLTTEHRQQSEANETEQKTLDQIPSDTETLTSKMENIKIEDDKGAPKN